MTFGHIYKIEFPNGKVYIGLTTTSLAKRKREHTYCTKDTTNNKCLYKALRKYNMVDNFELIGIDTADTLEELCKKEISYIESYNSHYIDGNGYNMTYGGEGFNGYKLTDENKLKMSESRKQFYVNHPEEIEKNRKRILQAHIDNPELRNIQAAIRKKNYQENPQVKQNISEGQKRRFENPEQREQLAELSRNFWNGNEEAKQKMSEIKKEQCNDVEWRNSQSERMKKVHEDNPELATQHSERMKKMHKDNPDLAKQHSERQKKRMENPEVRRQMSEIGKQYYEKTPGAREENSKRQKKRFKRQSERDKLSEIHKKRLENPEIRKQISETGKKYYKEHPEALEQLSKIGKELWKTPEHRIKLLNARGKNKSFDVFKKDGTFVKSFTYQFEAIEFLQKEYNITSTIAISDVLRGVRKSSAGFIFKYK